MSGFEPGSEEEYTLERTLDIFFQLYNYLWDNEQICFWGELRANAQRNSIVNSSTLRYLTEEKYRDNNDVATIVKDINEILEFRTAKAKDMSPGIIGMALKNKHKWRDKNEFEHTGEFKSTVQIYRPEKYTASEVEENIDDSS